jgi:hypothetical protein
MSEIILRPDAKGKINLGDIAKNWHGSKPLNTFPDFRD